MKIIEWWSQIRVFVVGKKINKNAEEDPVKFEILFKTAENREESTMKDLNSTNDVVGGCLTKSDSGFVDGKHRKSEKI